MVEINHQEENVPPKGWYCFTGEMRSLIPSFYFVREEERSFVFHSFTYDFNDPDVLIFIIKERKNDRLQVFCVNMKDEIFSFEDKIEDIVRKYDKITFEEARKKFPKLKLTEENYGF